MSERWSGDSSMAPRFIVDHNVGKLARWLRMMGYDSLLFTGADDGIMVKTALQQKRIILTRDNGIAARRLAAEGKITVILIKGEEPARQLRQVAEALKLKLKYRPFTLCLECNCELQARTKDVVRGRVPPHVFKTRSSYMECLSCHRVYWRGTHWEAMCDTLERFEKEIAS